MKQGRPGEQRVPIREVNFLQLSDEGVDACKAEEDHVADVECGFHVVLEGEAKRLLPQMQEEEEQERNHGTCGVPVD